MPNASIKFTKLLPRLRRVGCNGMTELPEQIKTLKADERGRVCLGTDYADEQVKVAVVEVVNK